VTNPRSLRRDRYVVAAGDGFCVVEEAVWGFLCTPRC
jgi:hypothetical protein